MPCRDPGLWAGPPAIVAFIGFGRRGCPQAPAGLLLIAAGDPDAIARWLDPAWRAAEHPSELASLALASLSVPWCPLPEAAWEGVAYRYRLVLGRRGGVTLCCWRRHGPPIGWLRRCGPMPLARFLQHRLVPAAGSPLRCRAQAPEPDVAFRLPAGNDQSGGNEASA